MKYGDFAIFVEEEVIFPPIGTGFLRYTIYNIYIYCISLSIYIYLCLIFYIYTVYTYNLLFIISYVHYCQML